MKTKGARALVIADGEGAPRMAEGVARFAPEVKIAASFAEAQIVIGEWLPRLVVMDLDLDERAAFDLLADGLGAPTPACVVVSGRADPVQAFRLAQLGVRSFVPKPANDAALDEALRDALERAPDLRPHIRAAVGLLPVHEIERTARVTMLHEALARSRGSKAGAAKLLHVSRQLLQHMARGQKRAC